MHVNALFQLISVLSIANISITSALAYDPGTKTAKKQHDHE